MPLTSIAEAGKGQVIDAQDPTALTDAFANEADALARQIVVTADVPDGKASSANVEVTASSGGKAYTASAYLPVRAGAAPDTGTPAPAKPQPVRAGLLDLPPAAMIGGVAAIGAGLLGILLALAINSPKPRKATVLSDQMQAYGLNAAAVGELTLREQQEQRSLAEQAKQAAERALANNASLEAKIAHKLEGAGMSLKPAEWLLMHGAIALGGALVGTLLGAGNILLGIVLFAVGVVAPWVYLSMKKSRRLRAFNSSLADTLQLMSGSLSAGLSLAQSIDTIVREGAEPITSEFKRVVIESRLGVTLEDSMEGVAERMESQDFHWVVMAIRIQREVGGNLAELLTTVAGTLRERDYLRRHVKALSAEGRLSTYILGGLPPGFLLYLTLTKPDYTMAMYTRPIGWVMCAAMAVLLGVGVLWMSKVSKVDL
jgi:tight adherence protein B